MPDYRAVATQVAQKYGIPPAVFLAQINQESGFNPNARSGAGALGIAQFMPSTAKAYGVDPMNPMSALDGAGRYDSSLLKQYGSVSRMLSAYNSGRADAYKDPNFAGGQTYNYVRSILGASGQGAPVHSNPRVAAAARASALSQAPQPQGSGQRNALLGYLSSSLGNYAKTGQATGDPMALLTALQAQQAPSALAPLPNSPKGRTAAPVASGGVSGIAKTALTQLGKAYQWGGKAVLGGNTDCSGLLQASARANGINLARTTYDQYKQGSPVSLNQLQPGDAVFSEPTAQGPGHVSIYIGNGKVVEDPHTGASVQVSTLAGRRGIVGARRY